MKRLRNGEWHEWLVIAILAVAVLVVSFHLVKAQEHSHAGHDRLHHWYSQLMRPDLPSSSCCSSRDCTSVQARWNPQGQFWEFLKGFRWIRVPESKINREESFDSQAHACWVPGTEADDSILCFVKPGAGI